LFAFNDEIDLPNILFNRIYVTFNLDQASLNVHFVSIDESREYIATVEQQEHYELMLDYVVNHKNLINYTELSYNGDSSYVTNEKLNLTSKTLVISKIATEKLVRTIYRDLSQVTTNDEEAYFTDGQRVMNVSNNNSKIEFINPIQTSAEDDFKIDLLEQSIDNINEHKGWTNDYALEDISASQSNVKFRLKYNG